MKKIVSAILSLVMTLSLSATVFAGNTSDAVYANTNSRSNGNVTVTDTGIFINGNYYSRERFIQLLDTAQEVQTPQTRSVAALVSGIWWIPVVGEVVISAGVIIVGGVVIAAGTWIYDAVIDRFTQRADISAAKSNIPGRLKDGNGDVKIGDFDQKVSGKTAYKEKGGWTIEKDVTGHGGKKWKLKNKSGERIASLDENGKVLGK